MIYIYGMGGHGRVVRDFFPHYTHTQFVEDRVTEGSITPSKIPEKAHVVVAIGYNKSRSLVVNALESARKSLIFDCVQHASAELSLVAFYDKGSMFCAKSVVVAGANIGAFCIINTGASVDHDCVVGDFVHIAPGANLCGTVTVGSHSFVGVGTSVVPGITIGSNTVIGAGSVVVSDIPSDVVAYGNPCKVIRSKGELEHV